MPNDDRNSRQADKKTEPKPELAPELTRLFKNRSRNDELIKKCKFLLIAGVPPGRVALKLRLPIERVTELYNSSYNPTCRRFAKSNQFTNAKLALTAFNEGAGLAQICKALSLPLYSVVQLLLKNQVSESQINSRLPPPDDELSIEYYRVIERKAATKFKPIQISPAWCTKKRTRKAESQTATA
ncbi:TPA: hypothetical protein ACYEOW_003280 [Raoultella terrigena]|uniref:Uncharacterized protein n=1 Tax=Raoultella terrigena TaxID=577 RepID=A0AAP9XP48_RAOTE|nr:hypothetical protein [Raoultella terrigena]QPF08296.1 hypothetical protein IMO34_23865 [Raoultella terrigena]